MNFAKTILGSIGLALVLVSGLPSHANGCTAAERADICDFKGTSSLTADEKFVLKKWGKALCAEMVAAVDAETLQCRYRQLVSRRQLNIAQMLTVAGYTAAYYNDLTPENIAKKPGDPEYEGFDVFDRVLRSALATLNSFPEFQYQETVYRGTSFHGDDYKVSSKPMTFVRWTSSSCVNEIAFGPVVIEKTPKEQKEIEARIRAEEGLGPDEEIAGLEYLFYTRDPKSVPRKMTSCQKKYYAENPNPPVTPGSHFGDGDVKLTILPPAKGKSKRVALYELSTRPSEAEILFPPGTKVLVKKVVGPDEPGGDGVSTHVTLEEIAE